ncbi:MAG: hypothetical protein IH897_16140, partial [Planctomycetes bacterium]|nr:hypothetical protein [Planctomycetota bacterium]
MRFGIRELIFLVVLLAVPVASWWYVFKPRNAEIQQAHREIEVKQGGYQAEYGRAHGGIVNVITHSGSNDFRVGGFGFFTNSTFAGDPTPGLLDLNVDAFSTYDVGVSLSGPLVRDRL